MLSLTKEEVCILDQFFLGTLPIHKIKIFDGGFLSLGSTRTIGYSIHFSKNFINPVNRKTFWFRSTLAHECVQIWQYHHVGWKYALGSIWSQIVAKIKTGSRNGAYAYSMLPEKPLLSYGFEQQAMMMQEYYQRRWEIAGITVMCEDFEKLGENTVNEICEKRRLELLQNHKLLL